MSIGSNNTILRVLPGPPSEDYDAELDELMCRPVHRSDEDTEDASEDGGDVQSIEDQKINTKVTEIKEQVYFDKLAVLKNLLAQLEDGTHPDFVKGCEKFEAACVERTKLNQLWERLEYEKIESDYIQEKKSALREFEAKKIELKENLLSEFEERKKHTESERNNLDILADNTEVKTVSTRKLRRRPNEPIPAQEKRRKNGNSQITFLLEDKTIDEDVLEIAIFSSGAKKDIETSRSIKAKSPTPPLNTQDIRIEDGKLFFEKRWFHRGQQIYLEGKELSRTSAVICSISQDNIWVRKVPDNVKIRVALSQLTRGKYSVKRRA